MALIDIKRFTKNDLKNTRIQKAIAGQYMIVQNGKDKILQIDTFGSDERAIAGKVSQSLQFDRETLMLLKALIDKEFK